MIATCHGCGKELNLSKFEVYPYPEDSITDRPIPPMFHVVCEPDTDLDPDCLWRRATVCFECFHRLQPDMWISHYCWEGLNPVTPFLKLPPIE